MATQHPGSEPGGDVNAAAANAGVNAAQVDGGANATGVHGGANVAGVDGGANAVDREAGANAVDREGGANAVDREGDVNAAVAALRERGAHRADPVRFRFIEALAQRAEGQPPAVRQRLDATLARAMAEYVDRYAQPPADAAPRRAAPVRPAPGPLAGLVQQLARAPAPSGAKAAGGAAGTAASGTAPATTADRISAPLARPAAGPAAPNELQALAYFRSTWARLAVHRSMNQSLAKTPKNAGPLNSHRLVLRALQLMQETSPAYLNRFVSYVDALLALERLGDPAPSPPAPSTPPAEGEKRRKHARG